MLIGTLVECACFGFVAVMLVECACIGFDPVTGKVEVVESVCIGFVTCLRKTEVKEITWCVFVLVLLHVCRKNSFTQTYGECIVFDPRLYETNVFGCEME